MTAVSRILDGSGTIRLYARSPVRPTPTKEASMRVRRSILVVAATLGGLGAVLPTAPASAGGGSWISPERSAYLPAEVAVFQGRFWEGSDEVRLEQGPFVAYLLPHSRWINGLRVPSAAIPVGELTITRIDGGVFRARVAFRVPDVPTGLYRIDYCNDPCTVRWLGDLVGSEFFAIAATRTEGRLLLQAENLRFKIREAADHARQRAAGQIRELKKDLRAAAGREAFAEVRVGELTENLRTTRRALEDERSTVAKRSVIVGGLLLAALALLVLLAVAIKRLRAARLDAELQAMTRPPASVDR
jgi:hypothetical protein